MERIKEYAIQKYPSRFAGREVEVEDKGSFWLVKSKDISPVILSKDV